MATRPTLTLFAPAVGVATATATAAATADGVARLAGLPGPATVPGVFVLTAAACVLASVQRAARGRRSTSGEAGGSRATAPVADRVRDEVDAMTSSLEQLSAEANSISFNVMISKGASEQARASMDQMAGNIGRVAQLAQQTQERAQRVSDLTADGETRARAALEDMRRLATSFADIEERVRPLLQHAGEIGSAAELIHRIASQTKLLSLNATIEAVRAGERGAGFAVVAEEVRKLADASSTASLQITGAVVAIQDGTATVADGVDQAADVVRTALDHVTRTYELLDPIRAEAGDTLERNREIATATGAEADLASDVVDSVKQLLELSDQTESVVSQALDTTLAMSRATDAILAAVGPGPVPPTDAAATPDPENG